MNTAPSIKFADKDYTQEALQDKNLSDLLDLRNLVASNLGVAKIKSFKNQEQAVDATWKALVKFDQTNDNDLASVEPETPVKLAKCAKVQQVRRPTRSMFRRLTKTKTHPGKGYRVRRWQNYKDGMTLLDCAETEGTTPLDVEYYVKEGFMKLSEPTDQELTAAVNFWYEKHGLENPAAKAKAKAEAKAKAKAEAKEAKEAAKEAKAKAKAEAKAAKAEAKAAKEAAKALAKEAKAKAKAEAAEAKAKAKAEAAEAKAAKAKAKAEAAEGKS